MYQVNTYDLFLTVAAPFLASIVPELRDVLQSASAVRARSRANCIRSAYCASRLHLGCILTVRLARVSAVQPRMRDLFFWAILMGDDELMLESWRHSRHPIRYALFGAKLARRMTTRMHNVGKDECFDRADALEAWAIGLLDVIPYQVGPRPVSPPPTLSL